jgi:hypothetical protein
MPNNDVSPKDKHEITSDKDINQLMLVVKERKVFWVEIPIDLVNSEGKNTRPVLIWFWQG